MRLILIVIALFIAGDCFVGCNGKQENQPASTNIEASIDTNSLDTNDSDEYSEDDESSLESLNDIRFADFDDDDWFDNEYIWALRHFLDDIDPDKIQDEGMKPYRNVIKGKFVIAEVEPALMGGLFIMFTFIDKPEDIFSTWVYSEVNEETGEISNYSVNGIKHEDFKSRMTKEQILKIVEERPELKLF